MVQVTGYDVVDVVAVLDRLVPAIGAVLVVLVVMLAVMAVRALVRIPVADLDRAQLCHDVLLSDDC
jgi:hypothetical protein